MTPFSKGVETGSRCASRHMGSYAVQVSRVCYGRGLLRREGARTGSDNYAALLDEIEKAK